MRVDQRSGEAGTRYMIHRSRRGRGRCRQDEREKVRQRRHTYLARSILRDKGYPAHFFIRIDGCRRKWSDTPFNLENE